jgi:threonine dehydratase
MPCSPRPTSCRPRRCAECAAVSTAAASENRDWPARVQAAATRLSSLVDRTRVVQWPGQSCWLKLESEQRTGSFKARGGANKLSTLSSFDRARGIVTASSGNHGAGVASAAQVLGCPLMVFVPEHADSAKVQRIVELGAEVRRTGDDCVLTEVHARTWAEQTGAAYVSPYTGIEVITGQGTVALELCQQVSALDIVYVAVGGGGLISGIGSYLKAVRPGIEVVACSPARSRAMHRYLEAGTIIDVLCEPTLSDATAGGVEPGAITLGLCQQVIDRSELASEAEILNAMQAAYRALGLEIEGAAGVALATDLREAERVQDKVAGVIICGGNVSANVLAQVRRT